MLTKQNCIQGLNFQTNAQLTNTHKNMDSTSDADFDYVKAEVEKFGRKPMEVTNKILPILICKK